MRRGERGYRNHLFALDCDQHVRKVLHILQERHASKSSLRNQPDENDDTTIEWADTKIGKAIIAAGSGK